MFKQKKYFTRVLACIMMVLFLQPLCVISASAAESYYWPTPTVLTLSRGYSSSHKGIDIAAPLGTNIYATKSGTVIAVGNACTCQLNTSCTHRLNFNGDWEAGIGSGVIIKHDDGSGYSIYGHMTANSWPSEIYQGVHVQQGQFIGTTGQSGVATGPHLHFTLMDSSSSKRWECNRINNNKEVIDYVYSYNGLGTNTENTWLKATGVTSITETTARINASLSPGATVSEAGFYLGTSPDNMQKKVEVKNVSVFVESAWYDLGTGKWSGALSQGTTYYYQIYVVIGGVTYKTALDSFTTKDSTPPVISDIYVTDVTDDGYTVVCNATDNVGIARVCFPTWTHYNGQDDLDLDWYNNATATSISGNTYSFRVNKANHNNESGMYTTHIYAYDMSGNFVSSGVQCTVTVTADDADTKLRAFVDRMYTVALGRQAEAGGVDYWKNKLLSHEIDGAGIAQGFIMSPEFKNKGYTNAEYIRVLYRTFFDRDADTDGFAYWNQALNSGQSRESVLSGFVNSKEFDALCSDYGISRGFLKGDGTAVNSGVCRFAERLYTMVLGRNGEIEGVEYWTIQIANGACTPEMAAQDFFMSDEYKAKNTSDEAYIKALYATFMDREAEANGIAYWKNVLNSGASREAVLNGFAQSVEFKGIMESFGL